MLSTRRLLQVAPKLQHASHIRSFASVTNTNSVKNIEVPNAAETDECLEVFEVSQRIPPTHNITVCNLQFRGYLPQQLDFYADFARRAAFHMGMPCSGTVPLPTQTSRWTVIKSPFVHKKSQENFERKTHKRLLQIKDTHPDVVDRWLRYLTMNAPSGIGMRATRFEHGK
ncbi:ribosomal protein S10 domain-containing protein [Absidia repens]|uniref:Small ribosomal subunit protein uS10m n=1 Tax=Absidia repens TaxID=90262 RepID=A0A1X2J175_9FUNG|nr:ribosomal protein S10 domain-containing protein [Absidia repens]